MLRKRKLWIILLATPFVLLAADTLYWYLSERGLENGLATWLAERRVAGWEIAFQPAVRGGWPLDATLALPAVALRGGAPDVPDGLSWKADRLVLRLALLRPGRLEVAAEGSQRLRLANGPEVSYTAEQARLVFPLQTGMPDFADLAMNNLRVSVAGIGDMSAGMLRLHLTLKPEAQAGEPAVGFSLRGRAIGLPPLLDRALGPRIASLGVEGSLNGPLAPTGTLADRAAAWRDGGGSLEIRHLALTWGTLDLNGTATLALDEQLQPMGAGSARAVGYAETLDALAAHGAITRSAATAAKAVLSLLAHSPDDGSPPDVEVPLTLQYRTLSMRQVPLLRLPEVDWP